MIRKIIFIPFLSALLWACQKSPDEGESGNPLVQKEILGVYKDVRNLFVHDPGLYQYAFNSQNKTFRIQNISQDRYFHCQFQGDVAVNNSVEMKIETKGISSLPPQAITVRVLKMSGGKVWLYNDDSKLGFVVRLE